MNHRADIWTSGEAYEPYMGRWSRVVGRDVIAWLGMPPGARWLDIGCGTGALIATILDRCAPRQVLGIDPSAAYLAHAQARLVDSRVGLCLGDAQALPVKDGTFDAAIAGLVLDFVPDKTRALTEMKRAARPGGLVAAYLWDNSGQMQLLQSFRNAAAALDPAGFAARPDQHPPVPQAEALRTLFASANLGAVEVRAVDVPMVFGSFDDCWRPFLGGQGFLPHYCASLPEDRRAALRERFRAALPSRADGRIVLMARAWAARGEVPPATPPPRRAGRGGAGSGRSRPRSASPGHRSG